METMLGDLRHAARRLRNAPGFTLVAVLTLALGIGATSAIFSVVNAVLLRPLPFPEPEQLVRVHTVTQATGGTRHDLSPPNFASLRDENRSFSGLALYLGIRRTLIVNDEPVELDGADVSAQLFDVLRVRPHLGRTFRLDENDPGAVPTVVLAYETWRDLFASDTAILSRTVSLNGVASRIIGVMPPGFDFPERAAFWTPVTLGSQFSAAAVEGRRSNMWIPVIARVRPGIDRDAATA